MAGLSRPFKSLPVLEIEQSSVERGERADRALLASTRTDPIPGSGDKQTCLPELAQQIANADTFDPGRALKRLQTFQTVRKALGQTKEDDSYVEAIQEIKPGFLGRLATQLTTVFGKGHQEEPAELHTQEKRALLAELDQRTGGRKIVHLQTFQAAMQIKGHEFAERLFNALDSTSEGLVTCEQLVDTLLALKHGTLEEKIAFIWSLVAESDSVITRSELQALLKASCSEGQLRVDDAALEELVDTFFTRAGREHKKMLSLQDFTRVLRSRSEIQQGLQFGNFGQSARNGSKDMETLPFLERVTSKALLALQVENAAVTSWLILIMLGEIAGFIVGFVRNDSGPFFEVLGWSYPVAKGAARSIQVIVILFPFTVARSLLTFLRLTPLHHILPLDEHLDIHKKLGYHFFFWGLVHSVCHFINASRFSDPSRHHNPDPTVLPAVSQASYYKREVQVTGVMMMAILVVCYLFAVSWPRQSWVVAKVKPIARLLNSFEAFYATHIFMAVSMLVLLIIHPRPGPARHTPVGRGTTWAFLVGGASVYCLERMLRIARQAFWSTSIVGVVLHKGGVTELRLRKPRAFRHGLRTFYGKAGQYCFLNIPELAKFEWHPFSLTSGPEDDFISFHIRSAGDWTTTLYKRCEATAVPDPSEPVEAQLDSQGHFVKSSPVCTLSWKLHVNVDGPFGAPAQDYSRFDCLLLVGAGIGVTPFASVLRQLVDEYNKSLCECCKTVNKKLFGPRKVYFYWMTREQTAPQFFKKTLEDIMRMDTAGLMEINIYLTAAVPHSDVRVTVTKIAQMIQHEKDGYDALAGTYQPAPCFFGKPSWPAVFDNISKHNPGSRVGVFVCGPMALSSQLKGTCKKYNLKNQTSEGEQGPQCQYIFHKENF